MIEHLLGDTPLTAFLEQHFLKLPFARAGGCEGLKQRLAWPAAARIISHPEADLIISHDGGRADVPRPTTAEEARELLSQGCTLGVRHADKHDAALGELARDFEADFRAPIDVHLYVTPAGRSGFGWHYDAEDVFVLQTAGSKHWELRKNTVNPWPLVETLPADMKYEREIMPLMRCALAAGDWLYIPAGYWHRTQGEEESISLSVGVLSPAAIDLFDFLRRELVESLLWRQRLPPRVGRQGEPLTDDEIEQWNGLWRDLTADLASRMGKPVFLERFLRREIV